MMKLERNEADFKRGNAIPREEKKGEGGGVVGKWEGVCEVGSALNLCLGWVASTVLGAR